MKIFANELSLHRQFRDTQSFARAMDEIMAMRSVARRRGLDTHCHRRFLEIEPVQGMVMQQAVQQLPRSRVRAVLGWLTTEGPFWDDDRLHDPDDYMECRGEVVTDSAVGEAAFRKIQDVECGLIGADTREWNYSPVEVTWRKGDRAQPDVSVSVQNWRTQAALEESFDEMPSSVRTWQELCAMIKGRFAELHYSSDCFEALKGVPFSKAAAERFIVLFGVLNDLVQEFDGNGKRTPAGHRLYREYFEGHRPIFTDSSETEKHRFRNELTFRHPESKGEYLFCPWHGKMTCMTLRLHFSWPVRAGEPLYVVYAGPKLTKV